jgi:hypothetical protein
MKTFRYKFSYHKTVRLIYNQVINPLHSNAELNSTAQSIVPGPMSHSIQHVTHL